MSKHMFREKFIEFLKIFDTIYYAYVISGLIPIVCFFVVKNKTTSGALQKDKILNFIFFLSLVRFITDITVIVLGIFYQNSLPAIHISVLLCYLIILFIIDEIKQINKLNYFIVTGFLLFISDLIFTSSFFYTCLLSSLATFAIVIGLCIWLLQTENITKTNERLIGSLLLFYLTAGGYYLYQDLMSNNNKIMSLALYLFITIQLLFNASLSLIIWSKRKT